MEWLHFVLLPPWGLMILRCLIFALCLARAGQAGTPGGRWALIVLGTFEMLGIFGAAEKDSPQTTALTIGLNLPLAYVLYVNWRTHSEPHERGRNP